MKATFIRMILIFLIATVMVSFFVFDVSSHLNLDTIKAHRQAWQQYYQAHQVLTLSLFAALYVFVTAFSLPVATVLTLLSGALFGLSLGLLLVSFSSTIGASLAFLMARLLAKDYVQTRYRKPLTRINTGFKEEGAFYLFALRLVPVFPFFMINLLMAILSIKLWTFYWVSQLGMLPGTVVYVYAGTQLGQIQSLSDITSPRLLVAFVLLGLFPLVAKIVLNIIRKKRMNR